MKICVFTGVFNEQRPIDTPGVFSKIPGWDYILLTNLPASAFGDTSWHIKQIDIPWNTIPKHPSYAKYIYANRYFKWHPQSVFSDYDVVIYVDGFQAPDPDAIDEWRRLIHTVSAPDTCTPVVHSPHPKNTCIYQEAREIVSARKDTKERMMNVETYLKSVNYPTYRGLFWNGCYVLNVKHRRVADIWEDLWQHMIKFSYRDQSLYKYVLWKNQADDMVHVYPLTRIVKDLCYTNFNHMYT